MNIYDNKEINSADITLYAIDNEIAQKIKDYKIFYDLLRIYILIQSETLELKNRHSYIIGIIENEIEVAIKTFCRGYLGDNEKGMHLYNYLCDKILEKWL